MAKLFKPFLLGHPASYTYNTYQELKRALPSLFKLFKNQSITVIRSRRGNWGEWFEVWEMEKGKPKIIKQGWM